MLKNNLINILKETSWTEQSPYNGYESEEVVPSENIKSLEQELRKRLADILEVQDSMKRAKQNPLEWIEGETRKVLIKEILGES